MRVYWKSATPLASFIPFLKRRVSRTALESATKIWEIAVDLTPVNSGELRASWNLSQGEPNYATVGSPESSKRSGPPMGKPGKPVLPMVDLNDSVFYVTNGKRYAPYVEYGSPKNAPRLMLTRAVQIVGR